MINENRIFNLINKKWLENYKTCLPIEAYGYIKMMYDKKKIIGILNFINFYIKNKGSVI